MITRSFANGGTVLESELLSEGERKERCISILESLGARNMEVKGDEIHHSCLLPYGLHPNGDRNPSASLNYRKLAYRCFVCGGGSLLWFVSAVRHSTSVSALQWIQTSAQTSDQSSESISDFMRFLDEQYHPQKVSASAPIPHYSTRILEQWKGVPEYVTAQRGIPLSTAEHFHVGLDRLAQRVVIPHFWQKQLVGWTTRRLADDGTPKYLHSPQFPKSNTIFNFQPFGVSVVVESPFSVLSKWHLNPSIQATFGAAVTKGQLIHLSKCSGVILAFDNDPAGWKATREVGEYLQSYTDVAVLENPWKADVADLSDEDFLALSSKAVPLSVWNPPSPPKVYAR